MQQKWNQNFDGELMPDIPQKFLNAGCDVYIKLQKLLLMKLDGRNSDFVSFE